MIVGDSSALIAVLEQEPEAERFLGIIRDASRRLASAITVYKTGIVIGARRGHESAAEIMTFLVGRSCRGMSSGDELLRGQDRQRPPKMRCCRTMRPTGRVAQGARLDPMDMLVKLYDLGDSRKIFEVLRQGRIDIRRALAPDKHTVAAWVRETFSDRWASETEVAFTRQPVSCFIAVQDARIAGFALP